jgi:hypothetical protein
MKSTRFHKKNLIMLINIDTQIGEIKIIITIMEITTILTLNGQIRYILEVHMVDFTNLKANKYHKIRLKIMNHK